MFRSIDLWKLPRSESVLVSLLAVCALAVYLPNLGLRRALDEMGQVTVCLEPLTEIVTKFHAAQNHPLYGVLGHFTIRTLPLSTVTAARIPALLAGLFVPLTFYWTHRRWSGREAALLGALLLMFADPVYRYATMGRGYSMLLLGVLLTNWLTTSYLEDGRGRRLLAYAVVGSLTGYAHLWFSLSLCAHGLFAFFSLCSASRDRTRRLRAGAMLVTVIVTASLIALLYLPMLGEIIAMARTRGSEPILGRIFLAPLKLARFGTWTVAIYLMLTPLVIEGLRRRLSEPRFDGMLAFHALCLATIFIAVSAVRPSNFGSRFVLGSLPSMAAFLVWALSGLWRGEPTIQRGWLERRAIWVAGFALGALIANVPDTYDMTPERVDTLRFHCWLLPRGIGAWGAGALCLLAAALWGAARRRGTGPEPASDRLQRWEVMFWTVVMGATLVPLALNRVMAGWLFETNLVALAVVVLLAWERRADPRSLFSLRYALLVAGIALLAWQTNLDRPKFDAKTIARAIGVVSAAILVLASVFSIGKREALASAPLGPSGDHGKQAP